ncbi:hypothetical protein [Rhizobium sp. L9]|nr:hypothetical protein [Rhizobium sp. L9]
MDTRLHALALPAADPSSLKDPELAAAEILETMIEALSAHAALTAGAQA